MEIITTNAKRTKEFGKKLATDLKRERTNGAYVIALNGDLGSGKTTFVQGFVLGLGVTTRLLSPTYIIVRRYKLARNSFSELFHIDLYRLENMSDLAHLGMDEILANPAHIVLIEWAKKSKHIASRANMSVNFEILKNDKRKITTV